jgi:chromatin remodeling complex protein RSC6
MMPVFMSTSISSELPYLREEAPYIRGEKSHSDDFVKVTPALALLVGTERQTQKEVIKRFWAYVAREELQVGEEPVIRVNAALRGLVGDLATVTSMRCSASFATT